MAPLRCTYCQKPKLSCFYKACWVLGLEPGDPASWSLETWLLATWRPGCPWEDVASTACRPLLSTQTTVAAMLSTHTSEESMLSTKTTIAGFYTISRKKYGRKLWRQTIRAAIHDRQLQKPLLLFSWKLLPTILLKFSKKYKSVSDPSVRMYQGLA